MENGCKYKGKSNIGLIIIIVLLSLLVIMLGWYFISHEFLNNGVEEQTKTNDIVSQESTAEEQEIEYKFDADKIVNRDTTYIYSLGDINKNADIISYEKVTDGYKFCSGNNCQELKGNFVIRVGSVVFKGGPGMGDGYNFLVSKDGDLYYVNEVDTGKIETGIISQVKDVVKLYVVDLISDREVSPNGVTVVAQTKDGSLYDIYKYVKKY